MSAEQLIASHLRIAADDLREAAILLEANGRNAVYLAQQAAEQLVLAIAQAEGVHFGREFGHRLDRMLAKLPDQTAGKDGLQAVAWLEAYATTYRYPRTSGAVTPPPDRSKLEEALAELQRSLQNLPNISAST
jgi:HEPN domain-containing protein